MKLLNLGRAVILILFSITLLFGGEVSLKVKTPSIYAGDNAIFSITASGDDIVFPKIDEIGGYSIIDSSTSNIISIINGKTQKSITKTYIFKPSKDVEIPPFTIKIDGKEYQTKPAKIKVLQERPKGESDNFKIELKVDKKDAYVGEPITFSVLLKQKIGFSPDKLNITPPEFKNFWVKQIPNPVDYIEGDYNVREFKYIIYPQTDGNLTINPITAQIGKAVEVENEPGGMFNDPFFKDIFKLTTTQYKWSKIASNSVTINVKPLPQGVTLYGKFNIEARPDKFSTKANEPVNVKIKITGEGNFDDIDKFKPDITDAVVYADEPKVKTYFKDGKVFGEFTQNIAIVPSKNFTIPPFKIKYFDKDLKRVVTKETKPIKIIVKPNPLANSTQNSKPVIEVAKGDTDLNGTKIKSSNEPRYLKYILLIIGAIIGFILGYTMPKLKREKRKKELPITKAIKKAKSNKEIFNLLLPYANQDEKLDEIIEKLEESIYKGGNYKPNKQDIIFILEDLDIISDS